MPSGNPDSALHKLLRRDRVLILASLVVLVALAWGYVLWLPADTMSGMPGMPAMAGASGPISHAVDHASIPVGIGRLLPAGASWSLTDLALVLCMWVAMMIGMMGPSAAPMLLIYAQVGRQAAARHKPFAATGWFAAGYGLLWVAFAVVATLAQWSLSRASLLTPATALTSHAIGGAVLLAAGVYQWTPLKQACLRQCQGPLAFIQRHGGFRSDRSGALRLGARHGLYCVGCCWVLMGLLFVGGVMNLAWIAGLAILVLIEKLLPPSVPVARLVGLGLVGVGGWLLWAG